MNIKVRYDTALKTIMPQENGDWYDLATPYSYLLKEGEYCEISLGVAMELPSDYEAYVIPRSSTFKKFGVLLANSFGLIDNSYCGNNDVWHFLAYATRDAFIPAGTRLCQFRIQRKMEPVTFDVVANLDGENRGGVGSTGF